MINFVKQTITKLVEDSKMIVELFTIINENEDRE